jgi:hypothetical protein
MQRGYDITHDKNVVKYINDNNNISAGCFFLDELAAINIWENL